MIAIINKKIWNKNIFHSWQITKFFKYIFFCLVALQSDFFLKRFTISPQLLIANSWRWPICFFVSFFIEYVGMIFRPFLTVLFVFILAIMSENGFASCSKTIIFLMEWSRDHLETQTKSIYYSCVSFMTNN